MGKIARNKMTEMPLQPSETDLGAQGLRVLARMIARAYLAEFKPETTNNSRPSRLPGAMEKSGDH